MIAINILMLLLLISFSLRILLLEQQKSCVCAFSSSQGHPHRASRQNWEQFNEDKQNATAIFPKHWKYPFPLLQLSKENFGPREKLLGKL